MTRGVIVRSEDLGETQAFLRRKGREGPLGHEGLVLWIGSAADHVVHEVLVPAQKTDVDYFDVSLSERQRIARSLAGTGRVLLCQVHSHPHRAWHSPVDDARALPRQVDALSLVVPDQARRASLLDGAALYTLEPDGRWRPRSIDLITIRGD
jgi:hypothetical protein